MSSIQPQRGMRDLFPKDFKKSQWISDQARFWAERYGFGPISTPLLEAVDLFYRAVGENTDIISKEMYIFQDRGGESICLRPEATASVMRAFLNSEFTQILPQKFYYSGPMFRYERPQKGRYRQFDQFGLEWIGSFSPIDDAEIIACGSKILEALGAPYTLEINTLGDLESRLNYQKALVNYLKIHENNLSIESQKRLLKNPLRILDSKDVGDQDILRNAPLLSDFLNKESQDFYRVVQDSLDILGISFHENMGLVRGLDYYSHTVFEFKSAHLGAQNAILAGGRYDDLCKQLGGKPTPAVGWALGVDRLALLVQDADLPKTLKIGVLALEVRGPAISLAQELRDQGLTCELFENNSLGKLIKHAVRRDCDIVVIVGNDEVSSGIFSVKDLNRKWEWGEMKIPNNQLVSFLLNQRI